jgi:hypothetical protein
MTVCANKILSDDIKDSSQDRKILTQGAHLNGTKSMQAVVQCLHVKGAADERE